MSNNSLLIPQKKSGSIWFPVAILAAGLITSFYLSSEMRTLVTGESEFLFYNNALECSSGIVKTKAYTCSKQEESAERIAENIQWPYIGTLECERDYGINMCSPDSSGNWVPKMSGFLLVKSKEEVHSIPVFYSSLYEQTFLANGYSINEDRMLPVFDSNQIENLYKGRTLSSEVCVSGKCTSRIKLSQSTSKKLKLSLLDPLKGD